MNQIVKDALETLPDSYPWIACVQMKSCDLEISQELAPKAVETALHVIRVIIGASHTQRIRLAWSRGDALRTAGLWADAKGVIHARVASRSLGPVGAENWYDALTYSGGYELKVFGSALTPLADPKDIFELHARFIDAINWFGDAATDNEATASVVKYTSAIERLIFGEYSRGHKITFAKRVESLLKAFDCDDAENAYGDALKVYVIRSTLLHGASSPRDEEARNLAPIAEQLARLCLLCAAQLYPMTMRAYDNPKQKELEEVMRLIEAGGLDTLALRAGYSISRCAA